MSKRLRDDIVFVWMMSGGVVALVLVAVVFGVLGVTFGSTGDGVLGCVSSLVGLYVGGKLGKRQERRRGN